MIQNPYEQTLQTFAKQSLKSKIFKGFYQERRYVDLISEYRDLITLHSSEKEFKLLLEDVCNRLFYFYSGKNSNMWIGITNYVLVPGTANEICIWTELGELAFGQYWFSVKTLKFRNNEVIIKLKTIRPVGDDSSEINWNKKLLIPSTFPLDNSNVINDQIIPNNLNNNSIGLNQFLELFSSWGTSTKESIYKFMSEDISKQNIGNTIKFILLLSLSLLTGIAYAIKMFGFFTIRLAAELNQFTRVATPIILAIIEMFSKIIGGFFILLAMIWRDITGGKLKQNQTQQLTLQRYKSPMYSLDYKKDSYMNQQTPNKRFTN